MSVPAAYLSVILIWSTTPLAIKWSAEGTSFAFAVLSRMLVGLVVAALVLAIWRIGMPMHKRARAAYLVGGLGLFGAMSLTYWGAQYLHSGLVSVLFGLTPLITGVMAMLWLDEAAMTRTKVVGMLLGMLGLTVIFGDSHEIDGAHAVAGVVALLAAVTVYSASLVWIKRIGNQGHALATTAGTLVISLPLFALVWWLADGRVPDAMPVRAGASILYLGVFGSVLGFAMYYYILNHMEAGKVALITLVTPVLALLLGSVLNGEAVSVQVWIGAVTISIGLMVHQWPMPGMVLWSRRAK